VRRQVKISCSVRLFTDLQVWALEDGDSLGALIRRILRGYLRNREKRVRVFTGSGPRRQGVDACGLAAAVRSLHVWIDEGDVRTLSAFAAEGGETTAELIRRVLYGFIVARRSHASEQHERDRQLEPQGNRT
jgi:hypothetical protein